MSKVLILSKDTDQHIHPVIEHLKDFKVVPLVCDIETAGTEIFLDFNNNGRNIFIKGEKIETSKISSIWYRRPKFKLGGDKLLDQNHRKFAEEEERITWDALWIHLKDNTFFLNNPLTTRVASNKIYQLELAKNLGLNIPDYLITNNPREAEAFVRSHPKVVYKVLSKPKIGKDISDPEFKVFFTNIVDERHLKNLDSVSITPCFFQEYIDKTYEVRVTVVGNKIFSAKIFSHHDPSTVIDYRRKHNALQYEREFLPLDVEQKCVKIVKELDLSFGAIDLIYNERLGYIFLEINPNGQWLWIEKLVGLPISKSIASMLAKGGE